MSDSEQPSALEIAVAEGNWALAAQLLAQQLTHDPSPEGFRNLAILRLRIGSAEDALEACDRSIALKIEPTTLGLRGDILFQLARFEESIAGYRAALAQIPDFLQAWINLAIATTRVGRDEEALLAWQHAHTIDSSNAEVVWQLAAMLSKLGRHSEARTALETFLGRAPLAKNTASARLLNLLGVVCHRMDANADALRYIEMASTLMPRSAQTQYNLGLVLTALRQYDRAIAAYQHALEIDGSNVETRWNLSLVLLRLGRWSEAWPLFEARLERPTHKNYGPGINSIPRWDGRKAMAGQKILLLAEQGLGDTLMFVRYAKLVAGRGFNVTVLAQKPLRSLLARIEGIHRVADDDPDPTPFDLRIELMSLPGIFETTIENIPSTRENYLTADGERVARWRERLGPKTKPRVGLMWRGRTNPWLAERSLSLATLATLLPRNIDYLSLQRSLLPEEVEAAETIGLNHFDGSEVDFEDAAALMELVDVVLTIDTSIAHLAGGMGRPTWILLPEQPEWRWVDTSTRSAWYSTVELCRSQPAYSSVADALKRLT